MTSPTWGGTGGSGSTITIGNYRGIINFSTNLSQFNPANAGDYWQAAQAGTLGGITFGAGDSIHVNKVISSTPPDLSTGSGFIYQPLIVNIATSTTAGAVKPDNTTINAATDGTISVVQATTAVAGVSKISSTNPIINGVASAGQATTVSASDHVHPSDTTKANLASPTFTGIVTLPPNSIAPSLLSSSNNSVTAVGTNQATAFQITTDFVTVTSSSVGSGVVVSTASGGKNCIISNKSSNTILVYPAVGQTFDSLGVNSPISLPVNGLLELFGQSSTTWNASNNSIINASMVVGTLAVANGGTGVTTSTGTGNVVLSASPTLTGTPTVPTASVNTNTTQAASTAFVLGQAASTAPLVSASTASVGTSTLYARQDHVHPLQNTFPATTFSSLPSASANAGAQNYVTDVGTSGSYWVSNGVSWNPVGGVINLFQNGIPVCIPPNGTITTTTGALTLGTALDNTYPAIYMWFPAGAWTGSSAGMYYVSMTSTTAGTVYSNQYTGGTPTIPTSPTLVTTGSGAYTQTTGVALSLLSYPMPANIMGINGKLNTSVTFSAANTAGSKKITPWAQFLTMTQSNIGFTVGVSSISNTSVANIGSTGKQVTQTTPNFAAGYQLAQSSNDTTQALSLVTQGQIATATDWIVIQSLNHQLTR